MKLRNALTLCPGILMLGMGVGRAQPLVQITVKSFAELSNAVVRVAGAVAPDSKGEIAGHLTGALGLTNTATFDPKGPWQLVVWQPGSSGKPVVALKGPIGDVKKFQRQLSPGGLLAKGGKQWVQLKGGIAAIVFDTAEQQSEEQNSELKQWEKENIAVPRQAVDLRLAPSEAAKAQFLPLLGFARMSMSQQMQTKLTTGANPKAIGQLFGLYFDGLEMFIKGLQECRLSVGVNAGSLVIEEAVSAKPGTDFAKWIRKPAHPLRQEDLQGLSPNAVCSGAVTIEKSPQLMDLMRKLCQVSLQLQNEGTNETTIDDLMAMVGKCLPARVSGSVFFKGGLGFSAVYSFPETKAATAYEQMKPLLKRWVQTQAGEGKMYSAASFKEKFRTVAGIPVDRVSFTLNLDNPLYQHPAQKTTIESIFPGGKMDFDYAIKDNRMLVASPARMVGLIEGSNRGGTGSPFQVNDATVVVGYFGLLDLIRDTVAANPAIPDTVKEQMAKIEPQGTAIRFQLEMDNNLRCETRVPLKFFSQIGRLKPHGE